jgi:hypothetical protein
LEWLESSVREWYPKPTAEYSIERQDSDEAGRNITELAEWQHGMPLKNKRKR